MCDVESKTTDVVRAHSIVETTIYEAPWTDLDVTDFFD